MDPVVHFEMPYDDRERIARFYRAAFEWELQMLGPDMGNYVLATTAERDGPPEAKRGAINGGFFPRQPDMPGQHPSVVIAVEDIAASSRKVKDAGGEVLGEPMEIPGVGLYVAFFDTERNRLSMLQPKRAGA
ncbi:VOC family protein [Ramlibacter sp. AN1133]|uniref:VOC family protein n=1 Tax=Ramlibacter sp. AN1133 TaxID=3133429 RepID=UPI0030C4D870